jgi:hypothetical protein
MSMIIFSTTRGPGSVKRGSRLETDALIQAIAITA